MKNIVHKKKVILALMLSLLAFFMLIELIQILQKESFPPAQLALLVEENIHKTGVTNPVTAVLLSFRAYDTLLEMGVLVLAFFGAIGLSGGGLEYNQLTKTSQHPILIKLASTLVPVMILTGGYLLWAGTHQPGGAFQAGAVLAVGGVLLSKAGLTDPLKWYPKLTLLFCTLGLTGFLLVGISFHLIGFHFLHHPQALSYVLIFFIETLIALSTASVLIMLYAIGRALLSPLGTRQ